MALELRGVAAACKAAFSGFDSHRRLLTPIGLNTLPIRGGLVTVRRLNIKLSAIRAVRSTGLKVVAEEEP